MRPTIKTLRQAVKLIRQAREMDEAARGCKGFKSSDDRRKLAMDLRVKGLWLAGKVTDEGFAEYLRNGA